MTQRNRLPYVEHSERLADGSALFALHNLTAKDIETLAGLLASRRALNTLRMEDSQLPTGTQHELLIEAERMDQLHRCLSYIQHQQ